MNLTYPLTYSMAYSKDVWILNKIKDKSCFILSFFTLAALLRMVLFLPNCSSSWHALQLLSFYHWDRRLSHLRSYLSKLQSWFHLLLHSHAWHSRIYSVSREAHVASIFLDFILALKPLLFFITFLSSSSFSGYSSFSCNSPWFPLSHFPPF